MSKKDIERLEITFNRKVDPDVIEFLNTATDNKAGFIKALLRDYVRYNYKINKMKENNEQNIESPSDSEPIKEKEIKIKKKPSNLDFLKENSFSSEDLDI